MTVLMAALVSPLAFLIRMANTLAIEGQTSKSTNATMAPLSTRMSKLNGSQLGASTAMDIIIGANGHHVELSLYASAESNVPNSMVARSL